MQGHEIIKDLTGEWAVYPGHPLVLATAIMEVFPDFNAANAPTSYGWCQALGDSRIPGAGCHVGAAMRLLKLGADGVDVDAMAQFAERYWNDGQAGGHHKNVQAGQEQAAAIERHFRERVRSWIEH